MFVNELLACCNNQLQFFTAQRCATGEEVQDQCWDFIGLFKWDRGVSSAPGYEEAVSDATAIVSADEPFIEELGCRLEDNYIRFNPCNGGEHDADIFKINSIRELRDIACCETVGYKLFLSRHCVGCIKEGEPVQEAYSGL